MAISSLMNHAAQMVAERKKKRRRKRKHEEEEEEEGACLLCAEAGETFTGKGQEMASHFVQVFSGLLLSLVCLKSCQVISQWGDSMSNHR